MKNISMNLVSIPTPYVPSQSPTSPFPSSLSSNIQVSFTALFETNDEAMMFAKVMLQYIQDFNSKDVENSLTSILNRNGV